MEISKTCEIHGYSELGSLWIAFNENRDTKFEIQIKNGNLFTWIIDKEPLMALQYSDVDIYESIIHHLCRKEEKENFIEILNSSGDIKKIIKEWLKSSGYEKLNFFQKLKNLWRNLF